MTTHLLYWNHSDFIDETTVRGVSYSKRNDAEIRCTQVKIKCAKTQTICLRQIITMSRKWREKVVVVWTVSLKVQKGVFVCYKLKPPIKDEYFNTVDCQCVVVMWWFALVGKCNDEAWSRVHTLLPTLSLPLSDKFVFIWINIIQLVLGCNTLIQVYSMVQRSCGVNSKCTCT